MKIRRNCNQFSSVFHDFPADAAATVSLISPAGRREMKRNVLIFGWNKLGWPTRPAAASRTFEEAEEKIFLDLLVVVLLYNEISLAVISWFLPQ